MKINCKKIAESIIEEIKQEVNERKIAPHLATILVGERADSKIYVSMKEKDIAKADMSSETIILPEDVKQLDLNNLIKRLAKDPNVDGILLQLPLPKHLNEKEAIELIPYYKDVDGLTIANQGKLMTGEDFDKFIQPCTPSGIIKILEKQYGTSYCKLKAVVVGRSNLLGNPLAQMLMRKNFTVTQCHSESPTLFSTMLEVNPHMVFLCTGQKNILKAIDIDIRNSNRRLRTIIDAGIIREESGLRGDFRKEDYDILDEWDIDYTSVPGGVGPMTTSMLAYNLLKCYNIKSHM